MPFIYIGGTMINTKKQMFHFHRTGVSDEIWTPGNTFVVDNSFKANNCRFLNGDEMTNKYKNRIKELVKFKERLKETEENYIYYMEKARQINLELKKMGVNDSIVQREYALEECRKLYFKDLPSRKHSVWLAEKEQLEYWYSQLQPGELQLLLVEIEGKLFKSSDSFFPSKKLCISKKIEDSKRYWNPVFKTKEESNKAEFLFQGKIKILKRLDY